MRTHIMKTLIAVAVASTLTACASHRNTEADTASMQGATTMDQSGYTTASTAQAAPTTDQAVADTGQMTTSGSTQAGASTTAQTDTSGAMASTQQQTTASTMQESTQAGTMSGQTSMDGKISEAGAMKTEVVEGSQMGASTGGATASSMDQQAVCGMYASLKSARTTEEREKVMTQILLNVPRGDSALVDVREQCGSAAP